MSTEQTKPLRRRPPSPQNYKRFDAWNSASTGHQRHHAKEAESVSWKDTRSLKLERQLLTGDCLREEDHQPTVQMLAFDGICTQNEDIENDTGDTKGSSKENSVEGPGEWKWVTDAEAKRSQMGVRDIRSFMGVSKRKAGDDESWRVERKKKATTNHRAHRSEIRDKDEDSYSGVKSGTSSETALKTTSPLSLQSPYISANQDTQTNSVSASVFTLERAPKIFAGATIFVNGSTLPLISDHKLKQLLVKHGAQISIYLARKSVSHMIIGQPNTGNEADLGAGGGLSARKLQQEIARGGWKGVKIISAEWYD